MAIVRVFDAEAGTTVVEAPGEGAGWWAGAASVCTWRGTTLLSYRLRAPRPRRGYALRIAEVHGVHVRDVWELRAADVPSPSLERAALVPGADGLRLYVSYVDGADGRWRIDVLEATAPERFDPRSRLPVLDAASTQTEGVKDPVIRRIGDGFDMLASFTPRAAGADHSGGDVFATGSAPSCTGRATSADGIEWRWHGAVLVPEGDGWDAYETRISCLLDDDHALYDGIASVAGNYEERTGLARRSGDRWQRLTTAGPLLRARYVATDGERAFYELTNADGSHELRVAQLTVAVDTERIGGRY